MEPEASSIPHATYIIVVTEAPATANMEVTATADKMEANAATVTDLKAEVSVVATNVR